METKVQQTLQTEKSFIPAQVGVHNKAIDILTIMQRCIEEIRKLKKQIDNISADYDVIPVEFLPQANDALEKVVSLHNCQVLVYRRLLSWYLNTISKGYGPTLYDNHDFYQMPDAQKNVVAAA